MENDCALEISPNGMIWWRCGGPMTEPPARFLADGVNASAPVTALGAASYARVRKGGDIIYRVGPPENEEVPT